MSEEDLESSVDSGRDLTVMDVGERPRVKCGLGARPETFSLDL